MVERRAILAAARRRLGTRWVHQGRGAAGLDCVGLIIVIARELGFTSKDVAGYARRQDGRMLLSRLHDQLQLSSLTDWQDGDIGVFREAGFPIHLGILTRDGDVPTVIHAHAGRRRVVEEALGSYGAPFLVFSFPGGEG